MSSSSTKIPISIPTSSSAQSDEVHVWYQKKLLADASKPKSPAQIRAAGEVKIKIGVLLVVGIICTILSIAGAFVLINTPEHAKDVWVIIGPIITAAITGTIGFFTGEKVGSGK